MLSPSFSEPWCFRKDLKGVRLSLGRLQHGNGKPRSPRPLPLFPFAFTSLA